MSRFLVVHKVPFTEEELIARAKAARGFIPKDVSWNSSYCCFTSNKHFCEWEAPDEKILKRILNETKTPFSEIYPVQRFDAVKAQFEPK